MRLNLNLSVQFDDIEFQAIAPGAKDPYPTPDLEPQLRADHRG